MKITVSKSELFTKLSAIGKIINSKNFLPAYDNFMFVVDEDGILKVTAGEEGGRLSTNIECETDCACLSMLIDAKTILEGLREIPEQPISIEIVALETNYGISVHYSNGRFELVGKKADEYPTMEVKNPEPCFSVDAESFLNGIRQVQICCANDELRPIMNGVFIEKTSDRITYVATDGHSLGMIDSAYDSKERSSFILHARMSKILSKIIPATASSVIIVVGAGSVNIEFGGYTMICRLVEGRFPNYRAVIPSDNDKIAQFEKNEMISALKRVSVFSSLCTSLIVLKFDKDNVVTITGRDIDFSTSAEEKVSVSYSGSPIEIGFKSSILIDLLSNIPSDEVIMSMKHPTKATIINRTDNNDLTYLIMPLVINN